VKFKKYWAILGLASYLAAVGWTSSQLNGDKNRIRLPSSLENSWREVTRFSSIREPGEDSPKIQLQQIREITKDDLLNCQFRLDISSAEDPKEITDILYSTGVGTSGQIRFIGRFFMASPGRMSSLPIYLQISHGSVTEYKAEEDPSDAFDSLALNRRLKILKIKCF
jgi:hypothetical protein